MSLASASSRIAALLALFLCLFVPPPVWAKAEASKSADSIPPSSRGGGKFVLDQKDPVASLPSLEERQKEPLDFGYWLMEASERGSVALQAGRFSEAIPYFQALALAVPQRATAHSKLCESYIGDGHLEQAFEACRETLDGVTVADYLRFVRLRLVMSTRLSSQEAAEIDEIFAHLRTSGVKDPQLHELSCEVGVRTQDAARLQSCVTELERVAPGQPKLTAYRFNLALLQNDRKQAESLMTMAGQQGFRPDLIQKMKKTLDGSFAPRWTVSSRSMIAILVSLALLASAPAFWALRSRRQGRMKAV